MYTTVTETKLGQIQNIYCITFKRSAIRAILQDRKIEKNYGYLHCNKRRVAYKGFLRYRLDIVAMKSSRKRGKANLQKITCGVKSFNSPLTKPVAIISNFSNQRIRLNSSMHFEMLVPSRTLQEKKISQAVIWKEE